MSKYIPLTAVLCCLTLGPTVSFAVNPADLIRLKKAGVSDKVISAVLESNAIDRAIISVDEIIAMKSAKLPDKAILKIIEDANPPVSELDREDAAGRELKREIKRAEMKLELLKKQFNVTSGYLSKLITNPEIIKLVKAGKISGQDYAAIVKYLKQYAASEETDRPGDVNIEASLSPEEQELWNEIFKGLRLRKDID
ncbi:MAG: hypothetical protein HWN68_14465 [Desulfobacterales bacterium]|nr:hypothetical protein [Desulfobacterales bacterium]